MVPRDKKVLWSFMFLLAGAMAPNIQYPFTSTCAVTGSTVILPCSFTPKKYFIKSGTKIPLKVTRARWCINHPVCQTTTPSLYDSDSRNNDPRYRYLGDLEGNCTLMIRGVGMQDNATFRFRMEANNTAGHFTNPMGVSITVVEAIKMKINSSDQNNKFSSGQAISLQCTTSRCTFNHLEVTWHKDGHTLSENGSTLHLSTLTAKDSGNYTCALTSNIVMTQSEPFSLQVEAEEEASNLPLIAGVVFGVLLVVTTLILFIFIIKRKRTSPESLNTAGGEPGKKNADHIPSSVLPPPREEAGYRRQETGQEAEEVSYASVQFKQNQQNRRKAEEEPDLTIYSSVTTRG
ncbi:Fc receptor-like protein 5 isoform X1 [Fundulus heteroclitus]|uniref:Fc receptor-like protein 5 isoform X1 n=1 Tax=Fundulus heteroclitus TaxID=8078 RepID=UPI00165AE277|nr:Fc receptor-like protein 5 isoform X1 [Fundulus heteroclitus]